MPNDASLKETLERCITHKRGVLAAHGHGSSKPWSDADIRTVETDLEHLKFMRDRVGERMERRSA